MSLTYRYTWYIYGIKHLPIVNTEIVVEARAETALVVYDTALQDVLVFSHPSVTARAKCSVPLWSRHWAFDGW